ncbi:MAG: flavodoxin [Eubacterium sp.]|jgi:flavodoxin
MAKKLVAYFSATGTTAKAAEALAKAAGADLFEIKPVIKYQTADLDWTKKNSRSTVEMRDPNSRPAIADTIENFGDYDTIAVGFPIWWYTAPRIIDTFFESYDFSGKTVVLFCTSGGTGLDNAERDMKKLVPDVKWLKGARLTSTSDAEKLAQEL